MQQSCSSKIRIPLERLEFDALDLRIRDLLLSDRLSELEEGKLKKLRRDLRKVDRYFTLAPMGRPLPETDFRPMYPEAHLHVLDGYSSVLGDELIVKAGWFYRVREYVERIEDRYDLPRTRHPEEDI